MSLTTEYVNFIKESPTPFHAIRSSKKLLRDKGFTQITMDDVSMKPGKFFLECHETMLIAFCIPESARNKDVDESTNELEKDENHTSEKKSFEFESRTTSNISKHPLRLVATHCDSPVLKLKPKLTTPYANLMPYGGGSWHTWFDRPLSAAGYVFYQCGCRFLIDLREPIFIIPNLAIHLTENRTAFNYDKEEHLRALYCGGDCPSLESIIHTRIHFLQNLCIESEFSGNQENQEMASINLDNLDRSARFVHDTSFARVSDEYGNDFYFCKQHNSQFIRTFSQNKKPAGLSQISSEKKRASAKNTDQIFDPDHSEVSLGQDGEKSESKIFQQKTVKQDFDFSSQENPIISHDLCLYDIQDPIIGGADNKLLFASRHDNLLSTFTALTSLTNTNNINAVAVFNHEEIGSESATGALTELICEFTRKLCINKKKSIIASKDVSHALNHNYSNRYDTNHAPILGKGVAVKHSSRYATDGFTAGIAVKSGANQVFCNKNTVLGGSTIGPMLCAKLGIQGFDVGAPILAMHSIKETAHVDDIKASVEFCGNFFNFNID